MTDPNLSHWWQPFTNVRGFRQNPRLIARAEGCFVTRRTGARCSTSPPGSGASISATTDAKSPDAVHKQLLEMDFAPPFQFGSPVTFRFAEKLAAYAPPGLDRVFFTNSGSEAVETAMKIAHVLQRARGKAGKTRFIARERGYHGVNIGGTSLQGIPEQPQGFPDPRQCRFPAGSARHSGQCLQSRPAATGREQTQRPGKTHRPARRREHLRGDRRAHSGRRRHGAAGGRYLQRLREICTRHDILLIFNEVVTGFGRTGSVFAAIEFGVTPDIMTAKAINGGTVPMGGVFVHRDIRRGSNTAPAACPKSSRQYLRRHPGGGGGGFGRVGVPNAKGCSRAPPAPSAAAGRFAARSARHPAPDRHPQLRPAGRRHPGVGSGQIFPGGACRCTTAAGKTACCAAPWATTW